MQKHILSRAIDGAAQQVRIGADQRAHARLVQKEVRLLLPVTKLRRLIENHHALR